MYHVGHFRTTITVLQMICKTCSSILLSDVQKQQFHRALKKPGLSYLSKKALRKRIYDACRKVKICFHCGDHNGMVGDKDNIFFLLIFFFLIYKSYLINLVCSTVQHRLLKFCWEIRLFAVSVLNVKKKIKQACLCRGLSLQLLMVLIAGLHYKLLGVFSLWLDCTIARQLVKVTQTLNFDILSLVLFLVN